MLTFDEIVEVSRRFMKAPTLKQTTHDALVYESSTRAPYRDIPGATEVVTADDR